MQAMPTSLLWLLQVDKEREAISKQPAASLGKRAKPDSMCYITFTSGSTGRPKGTVLQHAGVINYLHCMTKYGISHAASMSARKTILLVSKQPVVWPQEAQAGM